MFLKKTLPLCFLVFASNSMAATTSDWNGFYLGANAGYGWGHSHDKGNIDATENKIKGFSGGIQAGHNWQFENNIIVGVEATLSLNNISESWKDRDNNKYSPYYGKDAVKPAGTLNIKAGYAFDKFFPYATAGITVAKTEYTLGCDKSLVPNTLGCKKAEFETTSTNINVGANVGAGVMYKFTDDLSAGVEYIYTNLGRNSVSLNDPNYPAASERNFKTNYSTTTVRLNYHF